MWKKTFWAFCFAIIIYDATTYKEAPSVPRIPLDTDYRWFFTLCFTLTTSDNINEGNLRPEEIIEIWCLKLNIKKDFEVNSTYQNYIKPIKHPNLTPEVIKATTITQKIVDNAETFPKAFEHFNNWLKLNFDNNSIFITYGNWNLRTMFPNQCKFCGIEVPKIMKKWVNLRKIMAPLLAFYPRSLKMLLNHLRLPIPAKLNCAMAECNSLVWLLKTVKHYYDGDILDLLYEDTISGDK